MTGISVRKDKGPGKLIFLDRADLEVVNEIEVSQSVIKSPGILYFKIFLNFLQNQILRESKSASLFSHRAVNILYIAVCCSQCRVGLVYEKREKEIVGSTVEP